MFVAAITAGVLYAQSAERAKRLGAMMFCMCNCSQILTACNHVGCTMSTEMLAKLDQRVGSTPSDDLLLQSFVQEYGQKVLAVLPPTGFNRVAWLLPMVAFAGGLVLVVLVIRNWRRRPNPAPADGPRVSPEMLERARRQARLETED
jgi:cytochrome c-type biogenesis protein CcmH/NrfF